MTGYKGKGFAKGGSAGDVMVWGRIVETACLLWVRTAYKSAISAVLFSHVVVRVNFIPCRTEAIGCAAIVKKVGAGINRFGFYFNKMIFAGIGSPAQTIVLAR